MTRITSDIGHLDIFYETLVPYPLPIYYFAARFLTVEKYQFVNILLLLFLFFFLPCVFHKKKKKEEETDVRARGIIRHNYSRQRSKRMRNERG